MKKSALTLGLASAMVLGSQNADAQYIGNYEDFMNKAAGAATEVSNAAAFGSYYNMYEEYAKGVVPQATTTASDMGTDSGTYEYLPDWMAVGELDSPKP